MGVAVTCSESFENESPVERNSSVDICKFLGIFLVTWLHFGAPGPIDDFVHLFHMPVFFFLAGYCFNEKKNDHFGKYIKKRTRMLIVPYISMAILAYLFWNIVYILIKSDQVISLSQFAKSLIWPNRYTNINMWGGIQWFLPSLYFCELGYLGIARIKNENIRLLVSVLLAFWSMNVIPLMKIEWPIALDTSFVAIGYYGVGHWFHKHENLINLGKNKKRENVCLYLTLIITIIMWRFCSPSNLRIMEFGHPVFYFIGSISGCLLLLSVSNIIDKHAVFFKIKNRIKYYGMNTIYILFLHRLFDGIHKTVLDLNGARINNPSIRYAYFLLTLIVFYIVLIYPLRMISRCSLCKSIFHRQ